MEEYEKTGRSNAKPRQLNSKSYKMFVLRIGSPAATEMIMPETDHSSIGYPSTRVLVFNGSKKSYG